MTDRNYINDTRSCAQVCLTGVAASGSGRVVLVGRSSGKPPKSWFAGEERLANGVPIWAQHKIADYRTLWQDHRPVVVHAASRFPSTLMPSTGHAHLSMLEMSVACILQEAWPRIETDY